MAKIFEKIVNTHPIWSLEKTKILSDKQSGFHNLRSTIDNLAIIKSEITNAFDFKNYLGLRSIDIS